MSLSRIVFSASWLSTLFELADYENMGMARRDFHLTSANSIHHNCNSRLVFLLDDVEARQQLLKVLAIGSQ
jgi:hypothetical protein